MTGAVLAGAAVGWLLAGGEKTQAVRVADVLLLGPLMIWVASYDSYDACEYRGPHELARLVLAAAGGATITYNARNYLT